MNRPARTDYARRWGRIIRDLRDEQHMSQRELARMAGMNRSSLRRLERGQGSYCFDNIERALTVLGYELEAVPLDPGAESGLTASKRAATRLLTMTPCN